MQKEFSYLDRLKKLTLELQKKGVNASLCKKPVIETGNQAGQFRTSI